MYNKKLHISQIFSNLEHQTFKLYNLVMCNLYTKFVKFLEICQADLRSFCSNSEQNQCDDRITLHQLHQQQTHRKN